MTDPHWERLEVLLERAAGLPPDQRAAFVERETGGDPALGAELTGLLEASLNSGDYLGELREELLGSGMQGIVRDAAAADGPDPWIGRTVSRYEIVARIGGGGMGVIYRARDAALDRDVALKFIAPDIRREPGAQAQFLQEARSASALDHPNICTIHEIGEAEGGRQFIVMPAYEGETLRGRLDRPPIGEQEALDIARQVARALAAAHQRGIVHRDVKPDNVFLTRDGVVKLLDFGLARAADLRAGTVAYMSPEQASGSRADARSDVWAVGVMLYEMLAGRRPESPDFTTLAGSTPETIAVVRRSLSRDPAERPADGQELLEALNTGPRPRRLRVVGAIAGVLVVAAAAAFLLRPAPVPAGSVSHVLWVDDNPENNADVVKLLEGRGIAVSAAVSTADAVTRYDPAVHKYVISDMGRFEGTDKVYVERAGFELLAQLRAAHSAVKIIFCTSARAATSYRAEALAAGALGVVEDCSEVRRVMGL